jgi:hypothetical protein
LPCFQTNQTIATKGPAFPIEGLVPNSRLLYWSCLILLQSCDLEGGFLRNRNTARQSLLSVSGEPDLRGTQRSGRCDRKKRKPSVRFPRARPEGPVAPQLVRGYVLGLIGLFSICLFALVIITGCRDLISRLSKAGTRKREDKTNGAAKHGGAIDDSSSR